MFSNTNTWVTAWAQICFKCFPTFPLFGGIPSNNGIKKIRWLKSITKFSYTTMVIPEIHIVCFMVTKRQANKCKLKKKKGAQRTPTRNPGSGIQYTCALLNEPRAQPADLSHRQSHYVTVSFHAREKSITLKPNEQVQMRWEESY